METPAIAEAPTPLPELEAFVQGLGPCADLRLTPLANGYHSSVYKCENGPEQLPPQFVLRLARCPEAAKALAASCEQASELAGLPVPRILHYGRLALCGSPVVLEEYIAGEHKDFNELTPAEVRNFAVALAAMHACSSDRFSAASGEPATRYGTHGDYLQAMVDESVVRRLRTLDLSDQPRAARALVEGQHRLRQLVSRQAPLFAGRRFSRLHHDLNPNNVLWPAGGGPPCLIDGNKTYGDPADDVDYVVTNNQGSPKLRECLLREYCAATGCDDVGERIPAYTLKNQLDDLAWVLSMRAEFARNSRDDFSSAYTGRLTALEDMLDAA